MLVDLGGGTLPHPRADVVIDMHHPKNSMPQDATVVPWHVESRIFSKGVLPDDSVDEVYSSHFLEHIPKGQPILNVMNEAWRVLRSGGTFLSILPCIGFTDPDYPQMPLRDHIGWQPYADPTHVQFWWMPESFFYFCQGAFQAHANYGINYWAPLEGYIAPSEGSVRFAAHHRGPIASSSWWTVRGGASETPKLGWEAIVCLVKP